jgi:hypothetical protein
MFSYDRAVLNSANSRTSTMCIGAGIVIIPYLHGMDDSL